MTSVNAGPGAKIPESREDMFAFYDRLPPRLRRLLAYAPLNYACRPWWRLYVRDKGAFSLDEIERSWVRRMTLTRRRAVRELYGPAHPQATV